MLKFSLFKIESPPISKTKSNTTIKIKFYFFLKT